MPGAHNERERVTGRSAKPPRSRLKFQNFPTVVKLLNLEGKYVPRDRSGDRPGRDREQLLLLQRRGLIEDLEKQDYNLVVETVIERLRGGLRFDLSEPRGYVERSFMLLPAML